MAYYNPYINPMQYNNPYMDRLNAMSAHRQLLSAKSSRLATPLGVMGATSSRMVMPSRSAAMDTIL